MFPKARTYSRRDFLSASSLGLVSMGAIGFRGRAGSRVTQTEILHRTLGRTGLKVPIVNMGVMNANNPEIVQQAYEAGVRLFDTASIYQGGRNEEMVGRVIHELGVRDEVLIMTKTNARPGGGMGMDRGDSADMRSAEAIRDQYMRNFDGCLSRLQTDYVDILLCHGIGSVDAVNDPGVMEALAAIKDGKKARFAGIATHSNQAEVVRATVEAGLYDVVLVAFNFTMADNEELKAALRLAADRGLGVIAMKTQAGGRRSDSSEPVNHTAALKWVLRHDFVTTAIPGFTNLDHLNEDFSVVRDLADTADEEAFLSDPTIAASMGFCRQCSTCAGSCPEDVDIPRLMRTHMYAVQYANSHQAHTTYEEIPLGRGLEACRSCVACTARCSGSVDIARNIEDLRNW